MKNHCEEKFSREERGCDEPFTIKPHEERRNIEWSIKKWSDADTQIHHYLYKCERRWEGIVCQEQETRALKRRHEEATTIKSWYIERLIYKKREEIARTPFILSSIYQDIFHLSLSPPRTLRWYTKTLIERYGKNAFGWAGYVASANAKNESEAQPKKQPSSKSE